MMTKQELDLVEIVKNINRLWLKGKADEIGRYFHEKMVIVHPGFSGKTAGKDLCVKSYKDFIAGAAVGDYKEDDYKVDIVGDTAAVMYRFEIAWKKGEKNFRESGHDLFVFVQDAGSWKAVWRTLVPQKS